MVNDLPENHPEAQEPADQQAFLYTSDRVKQLDERTWAVQDGYLCMTEHGLMLAVLRIPYRYRKGQAGKVEYRWDGEFADKEGKRWLKIKVIPLES